MSGMNLCLHARWTIILTCVLLLLFTPSFLLAEDPYDEIPKLQKRIDSLEMQMYTSQMRLLASGALNVRHENTYILLTDTSKNLNMISREFRALSQYKLLVSMVTETRLVPSALEILEDQRDLLKKLNVASTGILEKTMHNAGDQETARLLLEARDLFRSSAELLDHLQISAP